MMTDVAGQIVTGEVSSLDDPDRLGRVKVSFPHLGGVESGWCPLVTLMAGGGRGSVFIPEVGDHVLVGLEFGDPSRGFILGSVWSQAQTPPEGDGNPTENNLRFIHSRSGHLLRFDDTSGAEKIEIIDKDGQRKVVIDSSGQKIQVHSQSGDVEVLAESGNVSVQATSGNVSVSASGNLEMEGQQVTLKSKGQMTIEAGGTLTVSGTQINLN